MDGDFNKVKELVNSSESYDDLALFLTSIDANGMNPLMIGKN